MNFKRLLKATGLVTAFFLFVAVLAFGAEYLVTTFGEESIGYSMLVLAFIVFIVIAYGLLSVSE